jgi:hypothetical protein
MDAVSSVSSGMVNFKRCWDWVSLISYDWIASKISYRIRSNCINLSYRFAIDFYGIGVTAYRIKSIFCGIKHAIHHSSEELILRGLRQPISSFVNLFYFLLTSIIGRSAKVIAITPIHLFLQFWYHRILKNWFPRKYPWFLLTHSSCSILSIWTKPFANIYFFGINFFGYFQAELDSFLLFFGITRPARTWNPIRIIFNIYHC